MSNSRFDRRYWKTILGIFELIVLLCLLLASICALVSSNGWAQQADWVSIICQDYQTNQYVAALSECSENNSPDAYSTFSANSVRTASIVIFLLTFFIVLIIFLVHIFAKLRKRKTWKIVTRIIGLVFVILGLLVLSISIAAIFWEIKLSTIFGRRYTTNSQQSTPSGYQKAQTGAAGAAAAFGLLGAIFLLINGICRFFLIGSLRKRKHRRRSATEINVFS